MSNNMGRMKKGEVHSETNSKPWIKKHLYIMITLLVLSLLVVITGVLLMIFEIFVVGIVMIVSGIVVAVGIGYWQFVQVQR